MEFLSYLFYAFVINDGRQVVNRNRKKNSRFYANDDISYRNADNEEAAWQQVSNEIVVPGMLLVAHFAKVTCRQYSGCSLLIEMGYS
jgi:hypothetical protein